MRNKLTALVFATLFFVGLGAAQFTAEPQLQEYRQPDITVDQEQNTATATFYLENTGGSFANIDDESWLIEIQPIRQDTFSFLSTIGVSNAQTCDPNKPKNVHKDFVFTQGEKKTISITTPLNGEGSLKPGVYTMKALTVTGCATGDTAEPNVQAVQPYGWGTEVGEFVVQEDTTNGNNVWIAYSNSNTCVQVAESNVPTNLQSYGSKQSCVENTDAESFPILPVAGLALIVVGGFVYWRWKY